MRLVIVVLLVVLVATVVMAGEKEELTAKGNQLIQESRALSEEDQFLASLRQSTISQIDARRQEIAQKAKAKNDEVQTIVQKLNAISEAERRLVPTPVDPKKGDQK